MADMPFRPAADYWTNKADLPGAIGLSERLRRVVDWIGPVSDRGSSSRWVLITCYDVTLRKLKFF